MAPVCVIHGRLSPEGNCLQEIRYFNRQARRMQLFTLHLKKSNNAFKKEYKYLFF